MDRVDRLKERRGDAVSVFHRFRLAIRRYPEDIFAFFEGYDDSVFYSPEIRRRITGRDLTVFQCSGKIAVFGTYDRIEAAGLLSQQTLFFVDKDLDDFVFGARTTRRYVFETTVYSIENYLVGRDVLQAVWTDHWNLSSTDGRLYDAFDLLERCSRSFSRILIPVMAWIIAERRSGYSTNLQNLKLTDIIAIHADWSVRRPRGARASIARKVGLPGGSVTRWVDILWWAKYLRALPEPKVFIRGKWELALFIRLHNEVHSRCKSGTRKYRPKQPFTLGPGNAVQCLVGLTAPPAELIAFLDKHI